MLGNGRLEAMCFDGSKRLCHIRGKLRKKVCSFISGLEAHGSASPVSIVMLKILCPAVNDSLMFLISSCK